MNLRSPDFSASNIKISRNSPFPQKKASAHMNLYRTHLRNPGVDRPSSSSILANPRNLNKKVLFPPSPLGGVVQMRKRRPSPTNVSSGNSYHTHLHTHGNLPKDTRPPPCLAPPARRLDPGPSTPLHRGEKLEEEGERLVVFALAMTWELTNQAKEANAV